MSIDIIANREFNLRFLIVNVRMNIHSKEIFAYTNLYNPNLWINLLIYSANNLEESNPIYFGKGVICFHRIQVTTASLCGQLYIALSGTVFHSLISIPIDDNRFAALVVVALSMAYLCEKEGHVFSIGDNIAGCLL